MAYSLGCEPLRVWSRMEPRARRTSFDRALRAEVYDAAWMLGRQWQFGEFKGEDTGSAVFAKLAVRTAGLDGFATPRGGLGPYSDAVPLEAQVEREPLEADANRRAQLGRQWLKVLDHFGRAFNAGGGAPVYEPAAYRQRFVERFPIAAPDVSGATPAAAAARARLESNTRLRQFFAALAGRAVDGLALARALPAGALSWASLPASITGGGGVLTQHRPFVVDALEAYRAWIASTWTEPESGAASAWNDAQLEYELACTVPRPGGGRLALRADEYASGRLDWYSFDLGPESATGGAGAITEEAFSVIPTPAEFPGQPNPRWWQLEDGAVDLGNIRADTTDLAKIIVAEFALLYGNNWLVIPVRQRAGSLAEVLGIVVTDVFGQRTLVESATKDAGTSWTRWDFFSLGRRPYVDGAGSLGAHLFLPPVVHGVIESEPVEAVRLLRDEMANMVWGVEARVPDGLGRGRDGHDAARRFRRALLGPPPEPTPPAEGAPKLRYVLGNTVPENWIPFIPVHRPLEDRAIRLQRASMPRFFLDTVRPVRPSTRILRAGLADDDHQTSPYYIHEEEVPRAGVTVEASLQRTRWYEGATFVWYGRRKRSGRGEGGSGLRFDVLEHVAQRKA